ncbi:sensor histidine kinase [Cohnella thermotolerans]|uniref:sensor histidine kinase n=1 Tax=Cohnella thermotolerans TaxID=329858 RepID=UPI000424A596|nr:ATP-binding protein [Cohnella thermotolerans]
MRNKPIRTQFLLAFLSFMGLLVLCLVVANLLFLKPYYVWLKTNELRALSDRIVEQGAATDSPSFERIVQGALYRSQASIDIYSRDGKTIYSTRSPKDEKERQMQESFDSRERARLQAGETIVREREEADHNMVNLATYRLLPNGSIVSLSSNMAPTEKNVRIFNQFLLLVCGLFLVVACLWAIQFATYFSKPIVGLQQLAHRMTQFDFSRGWQEKRRDELGALGRDMNKLSSIIDQFIRELKGKNEQLETELNRKNRLEEMRRMFVSNVSHELKTPIALIQGYAEGLRQSVNEDAASRNEYCEVIIDEAKKMNELVRELLLLSQLESGQAYYYPEPFDIQASIRQTMTRLRKLYDPKDVRFELELQPNVHWVIGDEPKIARVINNYITNAAKFARKPGLVRVSLEAVAGRARVSVFNTGPAIPEEELDQVWESFYKADKARKRDDGGTGLGLSIVKGIMDMHQSPYGNYNTKEGVVFWFELPLADEM